jgi:transposase InsO family protein
MEHESRKIVHTAVTTNPTDEWTAQQLKEATPWDKRPKYLIRDNDSKFGKKFSTVAESSGIEELRTPFQAPKANALCERLIGSLRRECLDHFLIINEFQLQKIVTQYADYSNQHRAHQGIEQRIPAQFHQSRPPLSNQAKDKVVVTPIPKWSASYLRLCFTLIRLH